jgi:hypothetical protein
MPGAGGVAADVTWRPACLPPGRCAQVMCCDYGFRTGAGRMYQAKYGQIPKNAWHLVRRGPRGCAQAQRWRRCRRRHPACWPQEAPAPEPAAGVGGSGRAGLTRALLTLPLLPTPPPQAMENFRQEYKALRRSFRWGRAPGRRPLPPAPPALAPPSWAPQPLGWLPGSRSGTSPAQRSSSSARSAPRRARPAHMLCRCTAVPPQV